MTMKCLVCDRPHRPAFDTTDDWTMIPWGATVFTSHGNFGSGVYDSPSDREKLRVVVCDDCLTKKAERGAVLLVTPSAIAPPPPTVTAWRPSRPDWSDEEVDDQ